MATKDKNRALSLLQGILDETASEAEAARRALEEELKRKEEEARARAAAEEQKRREEIAARIQAEEERQRTAAERRNHALEELRIEELKAKGLWKEPEVAPPPVEAVKPVAQGPSTGAVLAVQRRSNRMMGFAAAAVVFALVAGAGGAWFYMNQEFVDATTPFEAAAPAVVALADASSVVAYQAIPAPVVRQAAVETAPATTRSNGSRNGSRNGSSGSPSTETTGSTGPRLDLGGNLGGR